MGPGTQKSCTFSATLWKLCDFSLSIPKPSNTSLPSPLTLTVFPIISSSSSPPPGVPSLWVTRESKVTRTFSSDTYLLIYFFPFHTFSRRPPNPHETLAAQTNFKLCMPSLQHVLRTNAADRREREKRDKEEIGYGQNKDEMKEESDIFHLVDHFQLVVNSQSNQRLHF